MSDDVNVSLEIGRKIADLCRAGGNREAIETFYADDVVSVEACAADGMDQTLNGKQAVLDKNQWWSENHEVHRGEVTGPFPHGDRFILVFDYEVTPTAGPMANQRMSLQEAGLYTVAGGKVVKEEFFYTMG